MTELLSKLFARGNRLSDRFYSDRARPDRDIKQLERERREGCEVVVRNAATGTKKSQ